MAVQEPLEFLPRFFQGAGSIREVLANLRIAIQQEQCIEVMRLQAPKNEPWSLQYHHVAAPAFGRLTNLANERAALASTTLKAHSCAVRLGAGLGVMGAAARVH